MRKILISYFRQAVKLDLMEKNLAIDATVHKAQKEVREIWTAEMLMQVLEACDNKMLKIVFHLVFTATLRIGELLGLTWDEMDISEEAIAVKRAYIIINKQVERVSKDAVEALNSKETIFTLPSQKKNYCTEWVGCRAVDESAGKSGDGSVAYIIGKDNESIIS